MPRPRHATAATASRFAKTVAATGAAVLICTSQAYARASTNTTAADQKVGQQKRPMPTDGGVWIFDDAMRPEERGLPLSAEMIASKGDHALVTVGSMGVLASSGNPSIVRAVRHFGSLAAAQSYVRRDQQVGDPNPGALPCPADVDKHACEAWCEGVCPAHGQKLKAKVTGELCSSSQTKLPHWGDELKCTCSDKETGLMHAMCVSPCGRSDLQTCSAGSPFCAAGDSLTTDASREHVASGIASKAALSTPRKLATNAGRPTKFLLYDTKYGEGFNLQREVFPRAGWLVAELNRAIENRCQTQNIGPDCSRWVLVLPPWCRVVHWWSSPELVPWSEFFDKETLQSSKVPVMEFSEYTSLVKGPKVDIAVAYMVDQVEGGILKSEGEFRGWATSFEECQRHGRSLPEYEILTEKPVRKIRLDYSGHCDGGIVTSDFRCAIFGSPLPQTTLGMLRSISNNYTSVLLKSYDYLLPPENSELDALGLREAMLFSSDVREFAEEFILSKLRGTRYLAAHCRRTDFLRVRKTTTPDPRQIAEKLNAILSQEGLGKVFIATDAPDDLRKILKKAVQAEVIFLREADTPFRHPGKQAAAEMWIAARAEFFIGTKESRFTMHIQLERGFLGKSQRTSEQEFCKNFKPGDKPCIAPQHRHPNRKAAHRKAYV